MIRFGVPPIGGKGWFGGWMYMCNMVRALAEHGDADVETVLFLGPEHAGDPYIDGLRGLARTRIVFDPAFSDRNVRGGIGRTVLTGRNEPLINAFRREDVSAAFAPAIYLGWRSEIPGIAWFPDFQHRHLGHMFSRSAWWRRDLGFRAQVASSAAILLSSEDARRDCEAAYPGSKGRIHVARFAVPVDSWPDADAAWQTLRAADIPGDFVFLPNQLWQHKNHRLAVEAAGLLARRGSSRVILATGHGDDPRRPGYRGEIEALIRQVGAEQNFRLLGSVSHDMVRAMVIGANALLNPSRFEGWSTTVEEAKGVGTPLLLSNLGVHREQAPAARFFGLDDAEALADAIEASPPRGLDEVRAAMAEAREPTLQRQRDFARAVTATIRTAAKP